MSNLAELEANTMANDPLSVTNLPLDSIERSPAAEALASQPQVVLHRAPAGSHQAARNAACATVAGAILLLLGSEPPEEVLIPSGPVVIGNATNVFPASEGYADELPQHTVWVSAFFMGSSEVTWSLWTEVSAWAAAHGYRFDHPGSGKGPQHPVHTVSWHDVVKWCNARSQKEGLNPCYTVGGSLYRTGRGVPDCNWAADGYRLPTEAEWEKAARGGAADRRFPWDAAAPIAQTRANYYATADAFTYETSPCNGYHPAFRDGTFPYTSPVGSFAANEYGLRDMAGNVWEWCWDWYDNAYYRRSPAADPHGPSSGSARTLRGGSWYAHAGTCRVALRLSSSPGSGHNFIGFRLARTAGPEHDKTMRSRSPWP
jgi:formylglycine-generating enzyme required for sulfatase activity